MKREYESGVNDSVTMFVGREVEKTPAHRMKTLFVVGVQDPEKIIDEAWKHGCRHVYLGANMSFSVTLPNGKDTENTAWDHMVRTLLKKDLWVTLDYDVKYHDWVMESGYCSYEGADRFIPMISVKLPYESLLNYNACLKIDDKDFRASNPGVWVHRVHDLKDPDKFTDWSKYTNDEVINE
jgi:hypothetical protein